MTEGGCHATARFPLSAGQVIVHRVSGLTALGDHLRVLQCFTFVSRYDSALKCAECGVSST
jgi:hypothetical protein